MDELRMIQCYHCMTLGHTKDKCPQKEGPQICSRCGEQGHGSSNCAAPQKCHLCGEKGHPATARICQVYKQKFAETITKLLTNSPEPTKTHTIPSKTADLSHNTQGDDLLSAVNAAVLSSNSASEFNTMFFSILKASSSAYGPPAMTYDAKSDGDISIGNLSSIPPDENDSIGPEWQNEFESPRNILPVKKPAPVQEKHVINQNNKKSDVPQKTVRTTSPVESEAPPETAFSYTQPEKEQADTEEYVFPSDESEWTRLFDVLRLRLVTTELSVPEKSEGEGLLPYQNIISCLPLTNQVTIFQQLCLLTNTAIETAD